MPLLSAEQVWLKYGQFTSQRTIYRLIEDAVASGTIKYEETANCAGNRTVAGYCELRLCKYIFENRTEDRCARVFAHNVATIVNILASDRK